MALQLHLTAASVDIKTREGEQELTVVTPSPVMEVAKAILLCIHDRKHLNEYCIKKSKITRDILERKMLHGGRRLQCTLKIG